MVRQLLGNVRGQQGEKGEKGEQGESVENNVIGSENLFSMSREKWRYSGNIVDYDYKNGIIKFSNTIYQFRYEIYLRKGTYTVSVDDIINPERTGFENTVTLNLYDSIGNNMRTIGVMGGVESGHPNTRSFDISESEELENDGVFHIQIAIANSGRHTGEIRGLQIVRGELCTTWGLSTDDAFVSTNPQLMIAKPNAPLSGGTPTPLGYSYIEFKYNDLRNPDNAEELILSEGIWSFDWIYNMRNHTDGESCLTAILINDEAIVYARHEGNGVNSISTKIIANEGDKLKLTQLVNEGSNFEINGGSTGNNRMVLYKIGGL